MINVQESSHLESLIKQVLYNINMHSQLADHHSFEQLLSTEKETIAAHLESDTLKIRVVVKGRQSCSETYECIIKSSDVQGKLNEYFEHLDELKQYMKITQNVKIDLQKKMLDVIAKGPTKRASYILLCQFKLNLVQKNQKSTNDPSVSETEEWIDNLATEIISIIQSKSKAREKEEYLRNFVKKNELDEAIELLRNQLQISISKNTQEILYMKEEHIKLENKKILANVEDIQSRRASQQFARKQELIAIQNRIKEIKDELENKVKSNHAEINEALKQESQKVLQNMTRQINIKINQISINFSTKQEIDVIIKKVQNIGNKLENLSFENVKVSERDALTERLYMQEKKLNEIEGKLGKQTECREGSPPKNSSQFTPTGVVSAESWVDQACSHFGRISLKDNSITMISYGNARLFGKFLVKQKPTFNIKINAMANRMSIGIIDTLYKQNVIFGEEPNAITYQSDKRSWNGKKEKFEQGEGFKVDETVTVSVDMDLGTIFWKVGTTLRYSWQTDELRTNKIKWVPFVKMFDKGDKISLLQ